MKSKILCSYANILIIYTIMEEFSLTILQRLFDSNDVSYVLFKYNILFFNSSGNLFNKSGNKSMPDDILKVLKQNIKF